ncbi:MAG: HAD family phosphatase [Treponema sp.]|jgi:putative hydrolase of the HAD superfamily|nr:HAD family phosphatase [Treponema sp.]
MSIKTVVFDYGGVICFTPSPETEMEIGELTGLPVNTLRELHRKYRSEYDRGIYNTREYFKFILSSEGIFPDDPSLGKIAETEMDSWSHLNPDTIQLMRDVKAAGFTLGILSNMPHDFLARVRKNVPLFAETDLALFSCEYHLIKPEAAIYRKLKELSGCEFEEIVFFDDSVDNIAMAKKLGICGFVWEGPYAARETLKKIGRRFAIL